MEIDIKSYLSDEEIKEILKEEIRKKATIAFNSAGFNMAQLARVFTKEEVQKSLPGFEKLLNQHIKNQIKTIKLGDFFASSFGWRSDGNKIFNRIMSDNADLIDKKIKKIFK